jgi:pyrroline-5-carboxylate reductase
VRIGFIGAGRMAEALISRLGSSQRVIASDINKVRLNCLRRKYKVKVAGSNLEVFRSAEIVILAVKPQNMAKALEGLRPKSKDPRPKLVISIAAGIPLKYLQKKLPGIPMVRAMPNNPCLVGMGITALAKGRSAKASLLRKAGAIFEKVGGVVRIPEKWMDAVTGLSGSGPAFVYQMIEALTSGGRAAGLPESIAAELALQTVLGSAITVKGTGKSPRDLRIMVTSPGGTTVEGLRVLNKRKFSRALREAVVAAARKSKVLSGRWTT